MSLSAAIRTAQSILSNTSKQTLVVSDNIANANNPNYARRAPMLQSNLGGSLSVSVHRTENKLLLSQSLDSISASHAQFIVADGFSRIKTTLGGNDNELSPSRYLGNLQTALQTLSATPGNTTLAATVVSDAKDLADNLNNASAAVQQLRLDADFAIKQGVDKLNSLLADFEQTNQTVVAGTLSGEDVSQALDKRDTLLREISSLVGIRTIERQGNDLAIYTTGGQTLFEKIPRSVSFVPTTGFDPTTNGNAIYIDGVPLAVGQGVQTSAKGELAAQLQVRDSIAPSYQNQLDEIARGLVVAFAEHDQSASALPDMPGLFTWAGGTVPTAPAIVPGMSGSIMVNPALVPGSGNPMLLRDGGINGAAYVSNPSGAAGFSGLLDSYVTGLNEPMDFDPTALAGSRTGLIEYTSGSIGWLEAGRSEASNASETRHAESTRILETYSKETGVNVDEEMTLMLKLEQSYKASTKLLATIDEMMNALMAVVR
ncbi:flagellar hook-associated protein FlgK [Hoeflea prorocentri]|uniref:Flagellar hook-associated protein 1 n=1 Tax=Hoeflea prorocentri TaxID=1922333 RepID=A0A9X3ZIF1_9HYPH|nr:flagellar hook-associated protein FlgK [Hoeflea prorocentri]MCY6382379.1 flagellar hook-associated protein FlgK [Hoeflea prorocentri]MDA5400179.1 flagellar hook-associated protein FlgK [Hoeflea prorocentri]